MNLSTVVELEASELRFYSEYDEAMFFEWLRRISCVQNRLGRGSTLYVSINYQLVDELSLRELIALFHRYGINKKQLTKLFREEFADWFNDPQAYWHEDVFNS